MKALDYLYRMKKANDEMGMGAQNIDEAIAELETLQSRSCKGCKAFNGVEDGIILCLKFHYVKTGYDFNYAHFCCNRYEAKEQ